MNRLITNKLVIHHSTTPIAWPKQKTVDVIESTHKQNGLTSPGGNIAYHILIGHNWVYQGRSEASVGYHAGHWWTNLTSVAICLTGNFNDDQPTEFQKEELARQIKRFKKLYKIERILLHRQIKPTACPGQNITHAFIDEILSDTMDDMVWKEKYEAEVKQHRESIAEKELNWKKYQHELDLRKDYQKRMDEYYKEWQTCLDLPSCEGLKAKLEQIKKIVL